MRQKIIFLVSIVSLTFLFSCNNKKTDSPTPPAAVDTLKWEKKDPSKMYYDTAQADAQLHPDLLPPLPILKITKAQLDSLEAINPKIVKLIFQPGFIDVNDPTTIKVYMYGAKSHRHYGKEQKPTQLGIDESAMGYNVDENMLIGNVELKLSTVDKLKDGGKFDDDLLHIRLRPVTRTQQDRKYLSFVVEAIYSVASKNMILTGDLKPSPPAKPDPEE